MPAAALQRLLDGHAHGGARLLPAAPLEHQPLGFQRVEMAVRDALDLLSRNRLTTS